MKISKVRSETLQSQPTLPQGDIEISQRNGVKYIMSDDSWLLIRPSGTEPVLRTSVCGGKDAGDGKGIVGIWRAGREECSVRYDEMDYSKASKLTN